MGQEISRVNREGRFAREHKDQEKLNGVRTEWKRVGGRATEIDRAVGGDLNHYGENEAAAELLALDYSKNKPTTILRRFRKMKRREHRRSVGVPRADDLGALFQEANQLLRRGWPEGLRELSYVSFYGIVSFRCLGHPEPIRSAILRIPGVSG